MLEERPETVKRFMQALMQSWTEALDPENKEMAIKIVLKYNQETPEKIVRKQLPATRILMLPTAKFEFGKIDAAAWKQTEKIMLTQNLIARPVHIESRLRPVIE
jgi:NitT/TauT family transport system substrate-binding protein